MKIISFDQASHVTGFAVYDNEVLQSFGVLHTKQKTKMERMREMYFLLEAKVKEEKPDFVTLEGVQFQNNYQTYSQLSQLQGELFAILFSLDIGFMIIEPMSWKSYSGIVGRKRADQKESAIQIVRKMGITATEDECEAILQGKYALHKLKGVKE